jgi:enediyne biosynthesis protein E8
MEAWTDTIVPGEKRSASDRAVAGASSGPGAVQAGAWELMNDSDVGLAPLLPALAAALNAQAVSYAAGMGIVPDPTVPPFVALEFADRTAVAEDLLGGTGSEQLVWYALAAMGMLAFHTAAHLDTATAVRQAHPGLAWIRFPMPDADGFWRFPKFSYGRRLARKHPHTTPTGNPR